MQNLKNQEVYGIILSDQIWEGEIKITGDLYAPTNSTVTIKPGTIVKVAISGDKSNFDYLPWHFKSGVNTGGEIKGVRNGEPFWDAGEKIQIDLNNLVVQGSFFTPVTFNSDSADPSPYDFNTIRIKKGEIHQAIFSDYRKFEIGSDVFISGSIFKNTGECSICSYYGTPKIINNKFEAGFRDAIYINRSSPEISNNLFQNLIGNGIVIDAKRLSAPIITNNNFEMPGQSAINIISGGQANEMLIARNIFSGNSRINIACDTKARVRDNVILGQIGFTSGCFGGFTFGPNYWGTPDISSIMREKFTTKFDSYKVDASNILVMPPKDAGRK